ncbi:MAG: helix-turn-helix domain-containing protein [candidate division Zixibacteria bacterium]|nr:helix-turn-helix domain-containing protein [candidate division Zixibacteria bacterium]
MEKLLTPDQMAEYLSVQKSTIYQWTHEGFIPHIKLGKFVRFKASNVERWLEKMQSKGRTIRKMEMYVQ